jgi:hypothetical protein
VQADHYKLIRQIGAASAILLKNTTQETKTSIYWILGIEAIILIG